MPNFQYDKKTFSVKSQKRESQLVGDKGILTIIATPMLNFRITLSPQGSNLSKYQKLQLTLTMAYYDGSFNHLFTIPESAASTTSYMGVTIDLDQCLKISDNTYLVGYFDFISNQEQLNKFKSALTISAANDNHNNCQRHIHFILSGKTNANSQHSDELDRIHMVSNPNPFHQDKEQYYIEYQTTDKLMLLSTNIENMLLTQESSKTSLSFNHTVDIDKEQNQWQKLTSLNSLIDCKINNKAYFNSPQECLDKKRFVTTNPTTGYADCISLPVIYSNNNNKIAVNHIITNQDLPLSLYRGKYNEEIKKRELYIQFNKGFLRNPLRKNHRDYQSRSVNSFPNENEYVKTVITNTDFFVLPQHEQLYEQNRCLYVPTVNKTDEQFYDYPYNTTLAYWKPHNSIDNDYKKMNNFQQSNMLNYDKDLSETDLLKLQAVDNKIDIKLIRRYRNNYSLTTHYLKNPENSQGIFKPDQIPTYPFTGNEDINCVFKCFYHVLYNSVVAVEDYYYYDFQNKKWIGPLTIDQLYKVKSERFTVTDDKKIIQYELGKSLLIPNYQLHLNSNFVKVCTAIDSATQKATWENCPVKYYDGVQWQDAIAIKVYNENTNTWDTM